MPHRNSSPPLDVDRWQQLWQRLGLNVDSGVLPRLLKRLNESHRHYHDQSHIADCLAQLDATDHPLAADPVIELALWFHDAIYDTFSSRNEARSARWAERVLTKAGADHATCERVRRLIMATEHDTTPEEPGEQLMVDIDLAILGAPAERFDRFGEQIRKEYRWVPTATFNKKRAEVLRHLLERENIYATQEFRRRYEDTARDNVRRALGQLE